MKYSITIVLFLLVFFGCKEKDKNIKAEPNEQQKATTTENHQIIEVSQPLAGAKISSPLQIRGKARGNWFFEATAGVELYNSKDEKLAETYIEATENWMTEEFVPFKGEIAFDAQGAEEGYLILHKANPSGLPEHDDSVKVPIRFQ